MGRERRERKLRKRGKAKETERKGGRRERKHRK